MNASGNADPGPRITEVRNECFRHRGLLLTFLEHLSTILTVMCEEQLITDHSATISQLFRFLYVMEEVVVVCSC